MEGKWKIWKKHITKHIISRGNSIQGRFRPGRWLDEPEIQHWDQRVDVQTGELYAKQNGEWFVCEKVNMRLLRRTHICSNIGMPKTPSRATLPASIAKRGDKIEVMYRGKKMENKKEM